MLSARVTCVTSLVAALTWMFQPATSLATCARGPIGSTVWPKTDAVEVPVDTPIVVSRYYLDGDSTVIQASLAAADGTDVPLEELSRLPPPWNGCGAAEYAFFRPVRELSAGEKYTVTVTSGAIGPVQRSTFTVGESSTLTRPELDPAVTYLRVFPRSECIQEACDGHANLLIDLGSPPQQPLWLRVKGSHPVQSTKAWTFYPVGWRPHSDAQPELLSEVQLSVPIAAADSCVDLQIFGIEGQELFAERRCEPDRCAVHGFVAATNSGGMPGGSPVDVKQVPADSCDDLSLVGVNRAADDAGAAAEADAGRESYANAVDAACSVSKATSSRPSIFVLAMLALAFRRLARRWVIALAPAARNARRFRAASRESAAAFAFWDLRTHRRARR